MQPAAGQQPRCSACGSPPPSSPAGPAARGEGVEAGGVAGVCGVVLVSCPDVDGVCLRDAEGGQRDPASEWAGCSVRC